LLTAPSSGFAAACPLLPLGVAVLGRAFLLRQRLLLLLLWGLKGDAVSKFSFLRPLLICCGP
jgi:hypothetical protein